MNIMDQPTNADDDGLLSKACSAEELLRPGESQRNSDEFSRQILESSRDCIKMLDFEGRLLWMNEWGKETLAICNWGRLQGSDWFGFWKGTDQDAARRAVEAARAGRIGTFQGYCPTQIGIPKWWDVVVTSIRDARGQSDRLLAISRDITDHRQAEEAVRQSQAAYESLVNWIDGIVWELEVATFRFLFVSQHAERLLGYPITRWITEPTFFEDHLHPDDREWAIAFCQQATRDKRDHEFEYRMIAADGRTVWLRDLVTVVVENDQPVKLRGVMVDVTERKRADEALQKLNEKLEEQVTDRTAVLVAKQQELRSLAAELCRTEERERKRLATELHDNLAQLLALCNMKLGTVQQELKANGSCKALDEVKGVLGEALTYTRTLMTDLRPVLLGDQEDLSAAIFWVTEKMQRHGLIVEVQDDGEQKWLDEEILTVTYQSIQELLFNVLKHGKTKKAVLSLRCSGGFLEAVVRDEGTGFDVSTSRTPSAEGAFGLFSIRERLDLLGGRFEISSVLGAGTCAKVIVPLKPGTSSSHPTLEQQDAPNGTTGPFDRSAEMVGSKTQVLLVDDHRIIREGLRSIIEGQGDLEVVAEASDGEMALEATRATRPHVVIMDVNMPKMNGLEATRHIKAEFPNIMVVGLSMHDDAKIASGMRDAGASAYLSKERSFETLCATIRSVRAKPCEI